MFYEFFVLVIYFVGFDLDILYYVRLVLLHLGFEATIKLDWCVQCLLISAIIRSGLVCTIYTIFSWSTLTLENYFSLCYVY